LPVVGGVQESGAGQGLAAGRDPRFVLTHFTMWLQSGAVVRLATPSESAHRYPLEVQPGVQTVALGAAPKASFPVAGE
jgi:hypothetical protein